jgi:cyanate lyase
MTILNLLASKGYLLDLNREIDQPVPIFKSFSQVIQENLASILGIILILVIAFLIFLILRKNKKTDATEEIQVPIDPYEDALNEIQGLQKQNPPLSPKPFVFRLSEILRIYVERVFKVPAMELTGEEFMREIASHSFFNDRYDQVLREFIDQGDRIKYSQEDGDNEQMKLLLETALHFVKDTHIKLQESQNPTSKTPAHT